MSNIEIPILTVYNADGNEIEIPAIHGRDGSLYDLPVSKNNVLGGIKAEAGNDLDTVPAKIKNEKLYVDTYTKAAIDDKTQVATANTLGTVQAENGSELDTVPAKIKNNKLYVDTYTKTVIDDKTTRIATNNIVGGIKAAEGGEKDTVPAKIKNGQLYVDTYTKEDIDNKASSAKSKIIELSSSSWFGNQATIYDSFFQAGNQYIYIVSPAPDSISSYAEAEIVATTVASGSITFSCNIQPTENINVNISMIEGKTI